MATLTKQDKTEMRRDFFASGGTKALFKGSNPAFDGEQILAAIQAVEDRWEAGRVGTKAAMVTASGVAMTNEQAKALAGAWLSWKAKRGG